MATNNSQEKIHRATGLLIIEVENSNPNGDPDQENDPRRRSHDERGMISGVSFKRKLRDLILRKDEPVWQAAAKEFKISGENDAWNRDGLHFDILEDRNVKRPEVDAQLKKDLDGFKKKYWDARVFGNTFLEKEVGNTIRSGVAHFSLGVSVTPIRVHRLTQTKMAGVQAGKEHGMAPLAHRIVEHAVYTMPFFVNPTGAQGKRGTGCTALDVALLLKLIKYAYPHTKSEIRPLVEIRHAWYAEHEDDLGSFSEFDFIRQLTPKWKDEKSECEAYSVSGIPLDQQYEIPTTFSGKMKNGKLYDLCVELPEWCGRFKE